MRRIQYILVLILVVFLGTIKLFPQSNSGIDQYPEIGKPIPNFKLKNIQGHTTKSVSSEELIGKPYILYFWSKYCKSAVTGIFKVDSLYKEFGKDVNLFLIGGQVNDDGKEYYYSEGMEPGKKNYFDLYKALKENGNLNLPVLYDPELFHRFLPGEGVPHIIYVDKNGIIQAITYAIDHEKIAALIQGKKFFFHDRSAIGKKIEAENKYSRSVPYLIDKNGGNSKNFMFRSVLSRYSLEMPTIPAIVPKVSLACEDNYLGSKGRLEGKTSLKDLYRLAYLGYSYAPGFYYKDYGHKKDFSQIILELENDSIFKNVNYEKRNNLYVYSLIVPHYKATPEYLMQVMQNDLSSYFGYKARIEERQMPYWSITADTNIVRQYKTKNTKFGGRGTLMTDGGTKLGCRNKTINNYLASILSSVSYDIDIPIINECQVNWRIDIPLTDVFLFDFNEIKSVLKKQGFIVEKRTKAFNVLVISD